MRRPAAPLLLLLAGLLSAAEAENALPGQPLPGLPPEPRTLQLGAERLRPVDAPTRTQRPVADAQELGGEIRALRQAVARVRQAVAAGEPAGGEPGAATAEAASQHSTSHRGQSSARERQGDPRTGKRFGHRLSVQRFDDGSAEVDADLRGEPAEAILTEIAPLIGVQLEDPRLPALRRTVTLSLRAVPYAEAIDRLLGQLGLAWAEEPGAAGGRRLAVLDRSALRLPPAERDRLANRALERAASDGQTPSAAQAAWLMASRELAAGRPAEALRRFDALVAAFGVAKDPGVRPWVQRAFRGAGDAMVGLSSYDNARVAYRNYIARAQHDDPELPQVFLLAAEASRRLGLQRSDPIAFDEAVDDLHLMLERFAGSAAAAVPVARARLMVGELMFSAAQTAAGAGLREEPAPEAVGRFREAETQLKLYAEAGGSTAKGDEFAYRLAECAFNLGRAEEARPVYERLHRAWRQGRTDRDCPGEIYEIAAYRIGQCWLRRKPAEHVPALFAFLRARQDFPRSRLDPELVVAIALCYAELERDDQTVAMLSELLRNDLANDRRPGAIQLQELIDGLLGRLGDQPGPVRARVLFHIAQAHWRHAQRDRAVQAEFARQAAAHYERVLGENPPSVLRHAAKLGLARSALLAGDDARAIQHLRELLRDPSLTGRDREFAAQLLGGHYRDKGLYRQAIQAYRGEASE